MTIPSKPARYALLRSWQRSETGRAGLLRLAALGASWASTARPDQIVEALGKARHAPPLPPIGTFRDQAAFVAGAAWAMAWVGKIAEASE